jgi:hypothetical protein
MSIYQLADNPSRSPENAGEIWRDGNSLFYSPDGTVVRVLSSLDAPRVSVAASGGDYTTVQTAIAAGARYILVDLTAGPVVETVNIALGSSSEIFDIEIKADPAGTHTWTWDDIDMSGTGANASVYIHGTRPTDYSRGGVIASTPARWKIDNGTIAFDYVIDIAGTVVLEHLRIDDSSTQARTDGTVDCKLAVYRHLVWALPNLANCGIKHDYLGGTTGAIIENVSFIGGGAACANAINAHVSRCTNVTFRGNFNTGANDVADIKFVPGISDDDLAVIRDISFSVTTAGVSASISAKVMHNIELSGGGITLTLGQAGDWYASGLRTDSANTNAFDVSAGRGRIFGVDLDGDPSLLTIGADTEVCDYAFPGARAAVTGHTPAAGFVVVDSIPIADYTGFEWLVSIVDTTANTNAVFKVLAVNENGVAASSVGTAVGTFANYAVTVAINTGNMELTIDNTGANNIDISVVRTHVGP